MQLKGSTLYLFNKEKCNEIHSAHPWIFKTNELGQLMLANAQNTANVFFKKEIAVINYKQTNGYFWSVSVGVVSFHVPLGCQNIELFEYKLQQGDVKVTQWSKVSEIMKNQIQRHCGDNIALQCNTQKRKIQKIGNTIGSLFGSLSKRIQGEVVSETIQKVQIQKQHKQNASEEDKNNPEVQKKKEQQKGKWLKVKEQVKNINSKLNKKVQPARQLVSAGTSMLGEKFNSSENKIIKSIRDLGIRMKNSLNEGYNASKNNQCQKQIGNEKPIESQRVLNRQKQ